MDQALPPRSITLGPLAFQLGIVNYRHPSLITRNKQPDTSFHPSAGNPISLGNLLGFRTVDIFQQIGLAKTEKELRVLLLDLSSWCFCNVEMGEIIKLFNITEHLSIEQSIHLGQLEHDRLVISLARFPAGGSCEMLVV